MDNFWNTDYWHTGYWHTILQSEYKDAYVAMANEINKDTNGYIVFDTEKESFANPRKRYNIKESGRSSEVLSHVPFAIKNNIALEGNVLSCASALLEDFITPITASAVKQLLESGAQVVGLTNMDEFGMGSDTTHSIYGASKNPWDKERTAGGSSGGSAVAVSCGSVPFALGSDTGGSVRQPATFCGLWGLKPTYGAVSRYGLVAFASSLDVIGVLAEHPKWLSPVFHAMRVKETDVNDASAYYPKETPHTRTKKIGIYIPTDLPDALVSESLLFAKKQYESKGYEIEKIELPIFEYSPAVYINISTAEASTNLARFDGIRYGNRGGYAESPLALINNARSNGFGEEVKKRILTGTFVLRSGFQDQFYIKAQKVRTHIKNIMMKLFDSYDIIITPSTTGQAFRFDDKSMDPFQQKLADAYSVVANLAGIPAVSYPIMYKNNLPVGIQAMAPHYAEDRLFQFLQDTYPLFEHTISPDAKKMFEKTNRTMSKGMK